MAGLSKPSDALCSRLLKEVSFEDRFSGVKMTSRAGNRTSSIYSLEEAARFLHMDGPEDLLGSGSRASVGYLDLDRLKEWVDKVFGDRELAGEIGREAGGPGSYLEKVRNIKQLMNQRLAQSRKVAGEKGGA